MPPTKCVEDLACGMKIKTLEKENIIQVYGNTYPSRNMLRVLGGVWNAAIKRWEFKMEDDMKLNLFRELPPPWVCCLFATNIDYKTHLYTCEDHHPNGYKPDWFCGHPGAKITDSVGYSECDICMPPSEYPHGLCLFKGQPRTGH